MRNLDIARPDYIIKGYEFSGVYKVIKFKNTDAYFYHDNREEEEEQGSSEGQKLDNNIIRARSTILQYALCNRWDYFATLSLDSKKYDRYDLSKFIKDLAQFVRDKRKKYQTEIKYLLIPEKHKDGAWHMHGLITGLPDDTISDFEKGKHPLKLIKAGFKNYEEYSKKFGFISLGQIQDPVATAFYITKYITKDLSTRLDEYGAHLYYASQGLNRATEAGTVFGSCPELDTFLNYHGEFCSVGMVKGADWTFPVQFENDIAPIKPDDYSIPEAEPIKHEPVKLSAFEYIKPEDVTKIAGF